MDAGSLVCVSSSMSYLMWSTGNYQAAKKLRHTTSIKLAIKGLIFAEVARLNLLLDYIFACNT